MAFQDSRRPLPTTPRRVDDEAQGDIPRLQTGPWGPSDIVRITLERPEAAAFLARKLYRWFVSESGTPGPELIEPLAEEVKRQQFKVGPIAGVILRSKHFYSRAAYRQRIKSPVEFSAGLVRTLEVPRPALNPLALAAACDAQGQELFAPPNVEGWVGSSNWINSGTLLERTNWAADVVWGRSENGLTPFEPASTLGGQLQTVRGRRPPKAFVDLVARRRASATTCAPALAAQTPAATPGSPDGLEGKA